MRLPIPSVAALVALGSVIGLCNPCLAEAQVYQLAELNTTQIRALDRQKTVILIPGGILEQHGPYLPSYADGYTNERITADLAAAIARRPGWVAVVFPAIPLGAGGANSFAATFPFPGTYAVRAETLRAIFMDLGTEFGDQGFRWVFVIHAHGSPNHHRALDEAGEYFRDTYGGRMIHLYGLERDSSPSDSVLASIVSKEVIAANGVPAHAELVEQSWIMALRPDLVPPGVVEAPSLTANEFADLIRIATRPEWPGYFGAPRYATPELGRRLIEADIAQDVAFVLRVLDGFVDERQIPRRADRGNRPATAPVVEAERRRDATVEQRQREWLAKHGKR
jgi:creatinine amidohydrolase